METETIDQRIAEIEAMSLVELKAKWLELYGNPSPKGMSSKLLRRACIYQVQVNEYGGLKLETLAALKAALETPAPKPKPAGLTIGTRLIRDWHGRTYVAEVVEDGFELDGKIYSSLSALARHITGTRWNGRRFFGVKSTKAGTP